MKMTIKYIFNADKLLNKENSDNKSDFECRCYNFTAETENSRNDELYRCR